MGLVFNKSMNDWPLGRLVIVISFDRLSTGRFSKDNMSKVKTTSADPKINLTIGGTFELRTGTGIWYFQHAFACLFFFALYLLNRPRSRKILEASRNKRYKAGESKRNVRVLIFHQCA